MPTRSAPDAQEVQITTKAKLMQLFDRCTLQHCAYKHSHRNPADYWSLLLLLGVAHSLLGSIYIFPVIDLLLFLDLAKPVSLVGLRATAAGRAAHMGCKKVFK